MRLSLLICSLLSFLAGSAQPLTSPDGRLKLNVYLSAQGTPTYDLQYNGRPVILPSPLGIELSGAPSLTDSFRITASRDTAFDETWTPVWGEESHIRNQYRERLLTLTEAGAQGRMLRIRFRLFNDGLGFRYEFPRQPGLTYFTVSGERTAFRLAENGKAFWIPGDYDTNEYVYTTSAISEVPALQKKATHGIHAQSPIPQPSVQTPLMLKYPSGLYVNIHEAALDNYPALQLDVVGQDLNAHLVPDAVGNRAYLQSGTHTPWRTVVVSDRAEKILSSRLILNLNEPTKYADVSWIRPMKYMGVWWEYFVTGKSTWAYSAETNVPLEADPRTLTPSGRHGANNENVKKYIDFAAAHGIEGLLVEGWNTGWEDWFGNWKESVFDFVTPYPDFDAAALSLYARSKGVRLIMHHETAGSATNYERRLDTAFRFMNRFGYPAVKTGYVGKIIPRGEHHDGQWMVNHYLHVARTAALYRIMVNSHEAVRPTGLHRTYPNWIAQESARGTEFEAMGGLPPEHTTILPFTRMMGGPMDYTPGIFQTDLSYYPGNTGRVNTTLVKQLAYYVTMYSPLQMAADLPEHYARFPDAFQFIKDVAVDWDSTAILEAEPGDFVTIARKEKGGQRWFIGGVTDENARQARIPFQYLPGGRYLATIYADGPGASWDKAPQAYVIRKVLVDRTSLLLQRLAPGGGVAISVEPYDAAKHGRAPRLDSRGRTR